MSSSRVPDPQRDSRAIARRPGRSGPRADSQRPLSLVTGSELPEARRDTALGLLQRKRAGRSGGRVWLWAVTGLGTTAVTGLILTWGLWSLRALPIAWLTHLDQMAANWSEGRFWAGADRTTGSTTAPTSDPEAVLGHLPYQEAADRDLRPLATDSRYRLRRAAAQAFDRMAAAARSEGVRFEVISAFRSIDQQQQVFFQIKAERRQGVAQRAEVSAPPGYSEHHTGYAIDLGDRSAPSANLNPAFERTQAFTWLAEHAAQFNFELSFGRENRQGVAYEPWHWRFVGDRASLETFYKARRLNPGPTDQPSSDRPSTDRPSSDQPS